MKKNITLILLFLSSFAWGQKINKNILGLQVGGYYTPQRVERVIESKYGRYGTTYQHSSHYSVVAEYIPFAGRRWSVLINITSRGRIAEINLYESFHSDEDAKMVFDDLQSMLNEKYGEPAINLINSCQWGKRVCVSLSKTFKPSQKDGMGKYYVKLAYFDTEYSKQLETDILEEL